jgi:crotonobetainyl-CoA:carnitine CoA-transferase CaiB-like acyl-CoA transferase
MTCEGDLGKTLPLEGICVLDFSPYIAGPYCPALLGDLGAKVIKIEAHRGNHTRYSPSTLTGETRICLGANRHEQERVLDLKHEVAHETVYKLTKTINVVVEHFRPGVSIVCKSATSSYQSSISTWSIARFLENAASRPAPRSNTW